MTNPPAPAHPEATITPATPACRDPAIGPALRPYPEAATTPAPIHCHGPATGPHALPFRAACQLPGPATRTRSQLLGPVDTAPRCARGILLEALAAWNLGHLAGLRERSEAICSEIVTNAVAVSVAKAPPGTEPAPVVFTVAVPRGELWLSCWDPDPSPPPRDDGGTVPDVWAESGRGLFLVGVYASRWGWHPAPSGGKTVFAVVALDAPPPEWPEDSR